MPDLVVEAPAELLGWTIPAANDPVYHRVKRLDDGGQGGLSHCGITLSDVGDKSQIRSYERACSNCWRGEPATAPGGRRVARVRSPLVLPQTPVGPEDLRITYDGLLGVRSDNGRWIVIDPANPLLLETATDEAAAQWATLRSAWPTTTMISPTDIAEAHKVDRTLPAKWRHREPDFPRVSATIGDRPGWYEELWPAINQWVTSRNVQKRGRKPRSDT